MRTLLLHAIACCAALLPIAQAQAVEPAAKKYGDFKPGDTFSLKVTSVAPIGTRPKGFPLFRKNQTLDFKIGDKGQLTTDGVSVAYKSNTKNVGFNQDYYDNVTPSTHTLVHQAVVHVKNGNPYFINLVLRNQQGFSVYQVVYLLGKE